MRNIALFLTYLGTAYHGWQVQKDLVTVAGTLEAAAEAVVGHRVHITGCGGRDRRGRPCPGLRGQFSHRLHHPAGAPALRPEHPPAPGHCGHRGPGGP